MSATGAPGACGFLRAGVEVEGSRECILAIQFQGVLLKTFCPAILERTDTEQKELGQTETLPEFMRRLSCRLFAPMQG